MRQCIRYECYDWYVCSKAGAACLGSIQTGRANVKTTASLLYKNYNNNNNNNFITLRSHECGINEEYTDI